MKCAGTLISNKVDNIFWLNTYINSFRVRIWANLNVFCDENTNSLHVRSGRLMNIIENIRKSLRVNSFAPLTLCWRFMFAPEVDRFIIANPSSSICQPFLRLDRESISICFHYHPTATSNQWRDIRVAKTFMLVSNKEYWYFASLPPAFPIALGATSFALQMRLNPDFISFRIRRHNVIRTALVPSRSGELH